MTSEQAKPEDGGESPRPRCDPRPGAWSVWIGDLWQLQFPREFRIAAGPWSGDFSREVLRLVAQAVLHTTPRQGPRRATAPPADIEPFLADVATHVWRLRQKMTDAERGQPLDETRRWYRHVESIWDAFGAQGIEIRNHTGEVVPQGGVYGLRILACQPTPGVGREVVLETIKPTIRWREQTIQMGEVILAVPENTPQDPSSQSSP